MARELMLLVATAIVCLAPGIHGQDHLSFAADQQVKEISRQGCGSTRLCVETPDDCDPTHMDCLFSSVVHNTGNKPASFDVTLSGMSTGYIAMGLVRTPNEKPAAVFGCAQNNEKNGEFFFFTKLGDSEGNLTPLKQPVNEIRGTVHANNMITCEFSIPLDDVDMKMDTMLHVLLGTGSTTGKLLGVMKVQLTSSKIDLTDPKA